jgi:hypothetical protein
MLDLAVVLVQGKTGELTQVVERSASRLAFKDIADPTQEVGRISGRSTRRPDDNFQPQFDHTKCGDLSLKGCSLSGP